MKWPKAATMELVLPDEQAQALIAQEIKPTDDLGFLDPCNVDSIVELTVQRLPSEHSRRAYSRHLRNYLNWCSYRLSRTSVQQWVNMLRGQAKNAGTVNQALSAIKSLAREAEAHDLLPANIVQPILRVPGVVARGSRLGNWLDLDQTNTLVCHPDRATLGGVRDAAVLALLVGCGLRRTEAASLDWSHYQTRDGRKVLVDIKGKGNRVRTVAVPKWAELDLERWKLVSGSLTTMPISEATGGRHAILRALSSASYTPQEGKANIIRYESVHTKPVELAQPQDVCGPLTASGVWWVVKQHASAIGIPELAPHDLRRTIAHLMREAGAELEQIQQTLGHASVETTEKYVNARLELRRGRAGIDLVEIQTEIQPQIVDLDPPRDYDV